MDDASDANALASFKQCGRAGTMNCLRALTAAILKNTCAVDDGIDTLEQRKPLLDGAHVPHVQVDPLLAIGIGRGAFGAMCGSKYPITFSQQPSAQGRSD
jgi:hypothetical protein